MGGLEPVSDNVALDLLDQVLRSEGYAMILRRVAEMRAGKVADLIQPLDQSKTDLLRGFIAGVDAVLRVPDILKAEARALKDGKLVEFPQKSKEKR
jgi:hypothetical protein